MTSSKYEHKSLEELQADLVTCEAKVASQTEEIQRTETFILTFKDCLRQQHDALNRYILDRYKLKEERKSLRKLDSSFPECSSTSENSFNDLNKVNVKKEILNPRSLYDGSSVSEFSIAHTEETYVQDEVLSTTSLKRSLNRDINEELKIKKFCAEDFTLKYQKRENIKNESTAKNSTYSLSVNEMETEDSSTKRRCNHLDYKNKKVNQIIGFRHVVYICGSRGMLHIVQGNETVVLNTGTLEDITQMTLFKYNETLSLAVFSKTLLIVFIDVLKCQVPESHTVSLIGQIYVGKEVIYMPLKGGEIRKLIKKDCSIVSHIEHSHGNVRFYVPCYGVNKRRAMISLDDRKLYKTLENDLDILEIIEGIKNVRNLFRIGNAKYICCSKRKLWVLNSDPSIIETVKLEYDIKYIKGNKGFVVIVDESNVLLVYGVTEDEENIKKLQVQKFECNITGVSIENSKIHLMMSGEIVTLKIQT